MLPASLLAHLQQRFTGFFDSPTTIHHHEAIYGGDINRCFALDTDKGRFFIKLNASLFGLDMFEKEARGLILLADTGSLKVPRPLFDGKLNQQIYLVIEYIEPGEPAAGFAEDFGKSIAQLHHNHHDRFGLDYNNYIGKLVQSNRQHARWADFYGAERIRPLIQKAGDNGMLDREHIALAEKICDKLAVIFPEEPPCLLHGDLWKGNYLAAQNGRAAVFDPAVYYGHREMDLAMSMLFGGFEPRFYEAYNYHFPLLPGWQERIALCQLYPLLVHLLLFGGHYRERVIETMELYR